MPGRLKKTPAFKSEGALCTSFIAALDKRVWTPYPETCGWDILVVRKIDGFQIGIQAKLRLGIDVINQALEEYRSWQTAPQGPDCRAILVPEWVGPFSKICDYLGLVTIRVRPPAPHGVYYSRLDPELPKEPRSTFYDEWPEWCPMLRHDLPDYVPDVAAGVPSPVQLTDWKIKAIKIAIILDQKGFVQRSDFVHLKIDHRRFVTSQWIVMGGGGWVRGPYWPDFKKQHPRNYEQIKADAAKWMSKQDRLELAV